MVTSVTSPVKSPNGSLKTQTTPDKSTSEEDLVAALKKDSAANQNALVHVALRPTAILCHILQNSHPRNSSAITAPTFPSSPAKKGFVEKMFGRRKSVTLNESDPTFKTVYLGNVVTSLPKGDGCLKKPLEAIWKHYKTTKQPPADMSLTVTNAGLKARTAEQGIIQYKANRLTHCAAPLEYPRLFAWIYKHDAKNMKFESRCHAVLCHDEFKARELAAALETRLQFVFAEWLRQKRSRSQILDRLRNPELAAALPAMPARKQMLSAGQKYKPQEAKARSLSSIKETSDEDPDGNSGAFGRAVSMMERLGLTESRERAFSFSGGARSATPPFEGIAEDDEEALEEEVEIDESLVSDVPPLPEESSLSSPEQTPIKNIKINGDSSSKLQRINNALETCINVSSR